jgi:hypothetical protein
MLDLDVTIVVCRFLANGANLGFIAVIAVAPIPGARCELFLEIHGKFQGQTLALSG